MLINSENIKTCLMYYYRFNRQFPCVDEVATYRRELADVLVMTKNDFIEIEIKTSKDDLIRGEKRKAKHLVKNRDRNVNKYFVCVPTDLVEEAKNWVDKTNRKYGIIEFIAEVNNNYCTYNSHIHFVKSAGYLNKTRSNHLEKKLIKRLSSALINERTRRIMT